MSYLMRYFPLVVIVCVLLLAGFTSYLISDGIAEFGRGALARFDHIIEYKDQYK